MTRFTIPELQTKPVIVTQESLEQGLRRTLLLVVAHADDSAIFVGGIVAMWARAGWHIHCLRVTDDRWDSVGLDEAETIRRNAAEFRQAAKILGIAQVEDLGWQTDVLGDVSRVTLRERIIHAIRRLKPYGIVTFDPDSLFHEDNLDHRVLAQAVDEACWTSQFDKHHPEHLAEGLELHGVYER
jgi:N-acetylglucosamine malate deacetylase 1